MKNILKIGFLLILMISMFVVPVSSNDLQVDDVSIEFVQADNTQDVIMDQFAISETFTGEGITLIYRTDLANDTDMFSEVSKETNYIERGYGVVNSRSEVIVMNYTLSNLHNDKSWNEQMIAPIYREQPKRGPSCTSPGSLNVFV